MEASTTTQPGSQPHEGESVVFAGESKVAGLADRIGANVKAAMVFGDPIERDGVTIIPVAKARFGFGAGDGRRKRDASGSGGGGGGAIVAPTGYIEIHADGSTHFRRTMSTSNMLVITAMAMIGALAVTWTVKPSPPRGLAHKLRSLRRN